MHYLNETWAVYTGGITAGNEAFPLYCKEDMGPKFMEFSIAQGFSKKWPRHVCRLLAWDSLKVGTSTVPRIIPISFMTVASSTSQWACKRYGNNMSIILLYESPRNLNKKVTHV